MGSLEVDLTSFGADKLRAAVLTALEGAGGGGLPSADRLRKGAAATLESSDDEVSTYFVSMLEIGYLIASADGFAEEERHALATLLEQVTGKAVSHDALELHFHDLDDAVEMLGRRERLRRAAEDFTGGMGEKEALGFAAVVALADGKLAAPESDALLELGGHFGLSPEDVSQVIAGVVTRIKAELEN
ncbi:MAG: TerB family tellurite resistance protein [Myxococcales bacterium]|nr:TerB family tellurite resistance protein [Myxococcales bacterium]MCB9579508.1 TerB family tellurite resistance protein [Polyangiaceae bacterium]